MKAHSRYCQAPREKKDCFAFVSKSVMFPVLLLASIQLVAKSSAFILKAPLTRASLASTNTEEEETVVVSTTSANFNASESFGKMLMQMQKNEEALLAANENIAEEQQVLELDPIHKTKTDDESSTWPLVGESKSSMDSTSELPMMDVETARELDDAVVPLKGTEDELMRDVKVLPLNRLYTSLEQAAAATNDTTATTTLPLSRPEHYLDRINRDRRHLAVSIAASTEQVSQWRLFCQEQGGIYPILETVREGARAIHHRKDYQEKKPKAWSVRSAMDPYEEETFHAACSACRAIRDLCAISPEQAAVVTDSILRANAAWKGGLMDDFRTILQYASKYTEIMAESNPKAGRKEKKRFLIRLRNRRDTRLRCKLYVVQLLLAMVVASDDAVTAIRASDGLSDAILACSSFAPKEQRRRWLRYPGEMIKWLWRRSKSGNENGERIRPPFLQAASLANDLNGQVQRSANQILAALGYNKFVPKIPGQKGLRILSLDGGGSRGMTAVTAVNCLMESVKTGADVADSFDLIVGTSTGGIISFLLGLNRETSAEAVVRYQQLIDKIFVKGALSTPLMLFTTATYDESRFMDILVSILGENSMLDSRADPAVPLVCCLTSKMSSTPTHVALFRNYNYGGGELADPFTIDPDRAREDLELPLDLESETIQRGTYHRKMASSGAPGRTTSGGSRHPGSFRVLQRYALRASTAAPTVFKPVMMGGEMYCDGGIVASNPAAVAIHEARSLFPDIPIELVVSVGTGAFIEQKSAPRVGWDGIIGQIVNSATDGESIHHILEDVLGQSAVLDGTKSAVSRTRYFRFNPIIGLPDEFPIDVTDPAKLKQLQKITRDYMNEPEQQAKIENIGDILRGRTGRRRRFKKCFLKR